MCYVNNTFLTKITFWGKVFWKKHLSREPLCIFLLPKFINDVMWVRVKYVYIEIWQVNCQECKKKITSRINFLSTHLSPFRFYQIFCPRDGNENRGEFPIKLRWLLFILLFDWLYLVSCFFFHRLPSSLYAILNAVSSNIGKGSFNQRLCQCSYIWRH